MERSIKANGRTLSQGMFMQPWALEEHLAELARLYRVKPAKARRKIVTRPPSRAPEPAALGTCRSCGRTLVSATREYAPIPFKSLCGRCYDWPGERVDHAEWVARRRGEA